jgi:NADPH2:quinone reductase
VKAIIVEQFGSPDVFREIEIEQPQPSPHQVLARVNVAGVNFLDVYQRTGATPLQAPFRAGVEGVGTVAAVGAGVTDLVPGQRVGWLSGGQGSFAEFTVVDADKAVPVPDDVDDETAAACLMQGITAQYLTTDTYKVRPGDTVLVHAAAGGVGLMLTQMVKRLGGPVIGTASSDAKAEVARAAGADVVVGYEDIVDTVREMTNSRGVDVVYDGVGITTFESSLASLRPRGILVSYGASSGAPQPLDIARLNTGGSLYLTRPSVVHYTSNREELRARACDVFTRISTGVLNATTSQRFPISRIRDAFTELEERRTTGKVLLLH